MENDRREIARVPIYGRTNCFGAMAENYFEGELKKKDKKFNLIILGGPNI